MIFNNDLRPVDTTLFRNKLETILKELNEKVADKNYSTREELIEDFNRLLNQFYSAISIPSLRLRPVNIHTSPNYEEFNLSFKELENDLVVAFRELSTLEQTVIKNFNYMISEKDKIIKTIKRLNAKLDDYVIYATDPLKKVIYFKDSFNDSSKIDFNSRLLSKEQCDINTIEGIITLPINSSSFSPKKKIQVKINENSNGSVGNLQQIESQETHDDIRDILDGNPDTWFEYERVETTLRSLAEPLRLDLTLYTTTPEIVNNIRINPNNFGLQIPIKIKTIDTSMDGKIWTSIKDDIPIADFLSQDEDNIFTLSPSTSKYSGQGVYTFTPRKIRYIHLMFEQDTPYRIETSSGWKWRYAIGLRDIIVQNIQYKAEGEIISLPFNSPVAIRKLTVLANENPIEASELADVKHQISIDDGGSWVDIQPQDRSGVIIPEILEFDVPIYSLRHKMVLSRNTTGFKQGASSMSNEIRQAIDVLAVPSSSPATMSLSRSPVDGSVSVMNPIWGSRAIDGKEIRYYKENRVEQRKPVVNIIGRSSGQANQRFRLPLEDVLGTSILRTDIVVWVDNDNTWTYSANLNSAENVYSIIGNEIVFGDGTDGNIPLTGSTIGFTLKEERLQPTASSPYLCDLLFPSDGSKKNLKIYREDKIVGPITENLKPGATVHRLKNRHILLNYSVGSVVYPLTTDTSLTNIVDFVDGQSEFSGSPSNQYSIDTLNGIVYSEAASGTTSTGTIIYYYVPVIELQETDWDFVPTTNNIFNRIEIKKSVYIANKVEHALTTGAGDISGVVLNLGYTNVVPRSIDFGSDSSCPFQLRSGTSDSPIEVPYKDGRNEFEYSSTSTITTYGMYSVDYEKGIVYCNKNNLWKTSLTVKFEVTNYTAVYNIARYLNPSSYSIDATNKSIAISEEEIIRVLGLRDADVTGDKILKVLYDYVYSTRESIEELEPYFTPVVKDIVIKAIPDEV